MTRGFICDVCGNSDPALYTEGCDGCEPVFAPLVPLSAHQFAVRDGMRRIGIDYPKPPETHVCACKECRGRGVHEVIIGYADPDKQHACVVEIPCPACGGEERDT